MLLIRPRQHHTQTLTSKSEEHKQTNLPPGMDSCLIWRCHQYRILFSFLLRSWRSPYLAYLPGCSRKISAIKDVVAEFGGKEQMSALSTLTSFKLIAAVDLTRGNIKIVLKLLLI